MNGTSVLVYTLARLLVRMPETHPEREDVAEALYAAQRVGRATQSPSSVDEARIRPLVPARADKKPSEYNACPTCGRLKGRRAQQCYWCQWTRYGAHREAA